MTKEIEVDTKIYTHSAPPHNEIFVRELGKTEALAGPFPTLDAANEAAEKFRAAEKQESQPQPKPKRQYKKRAAEKQESQPQPKPKRQYKKRAPKVKPPTAEEKLANIADHARLITSYRPSLFNVWKRYRMMHAFCRSLAMSEAPKS